MNWDWPGGVVLWRCTVRVPVRAFALGLEVEVGVDRQVLVELVAPRLITAVIIESGSSWPATPA